MKTNEIREKYLEFFQANNHTLCPSDVLVPTWDSSVLFTPAGMNQFKDHFLGNVDLEFSKATSCQKCLRTGDIDNVGRTAYHHTFFEMLGNFSFGDYFKREAIQWAWEFLTDKKWLGIDPNRLTVTTFLDDDEAFNIWNQEIGLDSKRITRMDEYDNFWPAGAPSDGPDGVCGPCSEIFYTPDDGKEVEIWNLVFTQFERSGDPPNNLQPLPNKNIDTGMGLERAAAVLQGVETNYHIDTLMPIVQAAAEICSVSYEPSSDNGRRLRRITDHVRASTFCIHENVYPGAKKENYIVKRLLRRAVLDGHQMGMTEPFLHMLVPAIVEGMKHPYPELTETSERVAQGIKSEEQQFLATIDIGLERIDKIFRKMETSSLGMVPGEEAFDLYQTYGVPPEMFEQMATEKNLRFDWENYLKAEQKHQKISNTFGRSVMGDANPIDHIKKRVRTTIFVGYDQTECQSEIAGIVECKTKQVVDDEGKTSIVCDEVELDLMATNENDFDPDFPHQIVLLESPFYAESGGQVGDTGKLVSANGTFTVTNTQKSGDVIVHQGFVEQGTISKGESVVVTVDADRRTAIQRAHSATHILHAELQNELGDHAQQRGSKVSDDWLRFDFMNLSPVDEGQLESIESNSNERINEASTISAEILPLAEAKTKGAMMLFGEKYPDPVRMISMGDFSRELCGGTHLNSTGDVLQLVITSEENVSSGTRRITAITGHKAKEYVIKVEQIVEQAKNLLSCTTSEIPMKTNLLSDRLKAAKKLVAAGGGSLPEVDSKPNSNKDMSLTPLARRKALRETAKFLNTTIFEVATRIESMQSDLEACSNQLEKLKDTPRVDADTLIEHAELVEDIQLIVSDIPGGNPDLMRTLIDQIRKKTQPVAIFLAAAIGEDKVLLVSGFSRDLVERGYKAGDWVKQIAPIVGGGGGGKPDMAQAGGKLPDKIPQALEAAAEFVKSANVGG